MPIKSWIWHLTSSRWLELAKKEIFLLDNGEFSEAFLRTALLGTPEQFPVLINRLALERSRPSFYAGVTDEKLHGCLGNTVTYSTFEMEEVVTAAASQMAGKQGGRYWCCIQSKAFGTSRPPAVLINALSLAFHQAAAIITNRVLTLKYFSDIARNKWKLVLGFYLFVVATFFQIKTI